MSENEIQDLKLKIALSNKTCQWQVAEKLRISESRLSRILNGRIVPSAELLSRVKRLLGSKYFD